MSKTLVSAIRYDRLEELLTEVLAINSSLSKAQAKLHLLNAIATAEGIYENRAFNRPRVEENSSDSA